MPRDENGLEAVPGEEFFSPTLSTMQKKELNLIEAGGINFPLNGLEPFQFPRKTDY